MCIRPTSAGSEAVMRERDSKDDDAPSLCAFSGMITYTQYRETPKAKRAARSGYNDTGISIYANEKGRLHDYSTAAGA